jgi:hypothetical protein
MEAALAEALERPSREAKEGPARSAISQATPDAMGYSSTIATTDNITPSELAGGVRDGHGGACVGGGGDGECDTAQDGVWRRIEEPSIAGGRTRHWMERAMGKSDSNEAGVYGCVAST